MVFAHAIGKLLQNGVCVAVSSLVSYPVVGVVRDHDEQLASISFGSPLGNEHVLWPTASTEVELSQSIAVLRSVRVQVTESPLERNGHRRVR